jgi:hypothetical protein
MAKKKTLSRETLERLLYAVHNYPHYEGDQGERWTKGINAGLSFLYDKQTESYKEGFQAALALHAECMEQSDPEAYAKAQIEKGLSGERHGG